KLASLPIHERTEAEHAGRDFVAVHAARLEGERPRRGVRGWLAHVVHSRARLGIEVVEDARDPLEQTAPRAQRLAAAERLRCERLDADRRWVDERGVDRPHHVAREAARVLGALRPRELDERPAITTEPLHRAAKECARGVRRGLGEELPERALEARP